MILPSRLPVSVVDPSAPPARTVSLPVVAAGLATTAVTIVGAYWLNVQHGVNVMGWYANYVLPVGALLVGLLAGSGYGLASWLTGFKISRGTLVAVVSLQTLAYAVAQYLEYRVVASYGGALPTFLPYFDAVTRSIAFEGENGTAGQPLGLWGYGIRLLELVGFVGGGLLVPAGLRSKAYCADCQRYMKTRALATLPASVPAARTWGKGAEAKAAQAAEQETAYAQGMEAHDRVLTLATAGEPAAFATAIGHVSDGTKAAGKLPTRIPLSLASCPQCRRGIVSSQVLSGHGNGQSVVALASVDVTPETVRALDPS